jgi:16S rRNA (cytosine967-C5)-methyltransferase
MRAPDARSIAAVALVRVTKDKAFAAAALDTELDRAAQLEPRDRALATELVYGSLRLLPWLEARVARHAKRGIDALDPMVRAHLVLAAYQILVLERIPAFAAVDQAVTAVRALRGSNVGGFANAVLRKVAAEKRPSEKELAEAMSSSVDPALREAIVRALGEDDTAVLLGGHHEVPKTGIRVEDASARETWLDRLRLARPHATFELGQVSRHAILARGAGKVTDLPGWADGAWTIQEEGSQAVALAVGAKPGETVLDACAGRGNKTGILALEVRPNGAVDAADVHPKKLTRLVEELGRIGLQVRETHPVDWSRGDGGVTHRYDRVLIDAPCSGTGTIRRRPELGLRRVMADVAELASIQEQILRHVAGVVRPGGRVVYAVCSVLREEAEDVLARVTDVGLVPAPFDGPIPPGLAADSTSFRLLPSRHGTDGYFVASLRRE